MIRTTSRCAPTSAHGTPAARAPARSGGIAGAFRWLTDEWRRAEAIRELNRLSDHHLKDIGIARADIESVAEVMIRRHNRR
jgi:uncharacterized protein YjiS (DUF1127 family)